MPTAKVRAATILDEFEHAHRELVGKAVILTDGKAGTVNGIWLDETQDWESLFKATMGNGPSQPSNSRRLDEMTIK